MRCMNCGWDNAAGAAVCLKCGQSLQGAGEQYAGSGFQLEAPAPKRTVMNAGEAPCRPTMPYAAAEAASRQTSLQAFTECPHCGYPVLDKFANCPSCGAPLSHTVAAAPAAVPEGEDPRHRATIRRVVRNVADTDPASAKPRCSLTLIPEENERIDALRQCYEGTSVSLNRENTEPGNRTITSKEQAELVCEEGRWYLTDKSELQTTYVLAARKIEIQPGDIVVLGDRRFRFEKEI